MHCYKKVIIYLCRKLLITRSGLNDNKMNATMKQLILFTFILLLANSVFAHSNKALLRIRENRGRTVSVSIDGKRFNKMAKTLTVGDIPAGNHVLQVFVYNNNGHGYTAGREIYQGKVSIEPGKIYYMTVRNGRLDVEENCCIDDYGYWNNNDNWDDWNSETKSWNNNNNWNNSNYSNRNSRGRINNQKSGSWDSYHGILSQSSYQELLNQIKNSSFESSKVTTANAGLKNNIITVEQLIGILNLFSFESTKLDFAKTNYKIVADKQNFMQVNNLFVFQSSKDDLNEFLNMQ